MSNRFYKLISTSVEMRKLQAKASESNEVAVGISPSGALYKWNGSGVSKITSQDAAEFLHTSTEEIQKLVDARGDYEITDPEPEAEASSEMDSEDETEIISDDVDETEDQESEEEAVEEQQESSDTTDDSEEEADSEYPEAEEPGDENSGFKQLSEKIDNFREKSEESNGDVRRILEEVRKEVNIIRSILDDVILK